MAKKLTYKFVKESFEEEGYVLVSKEYINNKTKLHYICSNGHRHSMPWRSWAAGSRCFYCNVGNKRLNIKFIQEQFKKKGYILLTKRYINGHQKLNYICSKGHKHFMSWNGLRRGSACLYCSGRAKKTIEFIKSEFKKENYILLSTEYKNAHGKLNYICPTGHKSKTNWHAWQQNKRCPYCSGKVKYKIENIRKEFEKEGYILLTGIYINTFTKLDYICNRGHKASIIWHNWYMSGTRCSECKRENMFMAGNPNWKGGVSYEPYCMDWTKEYKDFIMERDGNTCLNPDCCNNYIRLSIHHVDYIKKNCDHTNLITLCTSCNSRANFDREWHKNWYQTVLYKRYGYVYGVSKIVGGQ